MSAARIGQGPTDTKAQDALDQGSIVARRQLRKPTIRQLEAIGDALDGLERAIMATQSGKARNLLCDANILVMQAKEELP